MPTLYITQPGSSIKVQGKRFLVYTRGHGAAGIPEREVDSVVAFGPSYISEATFARLFVRRVPVYFLTRFGKPRGWMCPAYDGRVDIRIAQVTACQNADFCLRTSRAVVQAKIANARRVIYRYGRNHSNDLTQSICEDLRQSGEDAGKAQGIPQLLGIEGSAAKRYFEGFGAMLKDDDIFRGRSRRPPTDPANALLSLGYTLAGTELMGLLFAQGLDFYVGFFHKPRRGLPALAEDLLEEFRAPAVDRLVQTIFNLGEVSSQDFREGPKGGLRLTDDKLRWFLNRYEKHLAKERKNKSGTVESLRKRMAIQVELLRKAFEGEAAYAPYISA